MPQVYCYTYQRQIYLFGFIKKKKKKEKGTYKYASLSLITHFSISHSAFFFFFQNLAPNIWRQGNLPQPPQFAFCDDEDLCTSSGSSYLAELCRSSHGLCTIIISAIVVSPSLASSVRRSTSSTPTTVCSVTCFTGVYSSHDSNLKPAHHQRKHLLHCWFLRCSVCASTKLQIISRHPPLSVSSLVIWVKSFYFLFFEKMEEYL